MLSRKVICIAGVKRVVALVEELASAKPPRDKRKLVNQILTLLDGQDRAVRMTPGLLSELIAVHSSCVHDQEGRCPLLVSTVSLCWELNKAMGVADETDRSLRRVDPMCAARPLSEERFDGNVRRGHRDDDQD